MDQAAEFDIRGSEGRESLARYHLGSDRQDNLTQVQIIDGLRCLGNYLGARDWMVWRSGGFVIPIGPAG
jgi:hypothetical protein